LADLGSVLLMGLLLWLEALLVLHKLLLHEQPVLDALQLEQAKLALSVGGHRGQLGAQAGALVPPLLLPAHAGGGQGGLPLLLLLLRRDVGSGGKRGAPDVCYVKEGGGGGCHTSGGGSGAGREEGRSRPLTGRWKRMMIKEVEKGFM